MTATFNGVSMTLVAGPLTCTSGAFAQQRVFQLDNPSQGSYTVSLSWTTGAAACGSSASYSGATSVGQVSQATGTFSYTKTVASGDMIVGCLAFADAGANNAMSPTADQYNSANVNYTGTAINHNSSTGSQTVSSTYSAVYTVGCGLYLSSSSGIVFDNSSTGSFGGSPDTFTHTCSASSKRILFVSVFSQGTISGATYNGVSMTSLGTYGYTSPTGNGELFMLVNPSPGPNTVSVSSSGNLIAVASSYTGAKQTGQPDAAINTQTTGGSTGSSLTATVSVTASGSWLVGGTVCEGSALTAGAGAYLRITGANPAVAFFDSNGAPGTGSQSMTVNESPSNRFAFGMVSFAPDSTNITVTPSAVNTTWATQAPTISAQEQVTNTPSAQTTTFATQAPGITGNAAVAPNLQNVTIALQSPQVLLPDAVFSVNRVDVVIATQAPTPQFGVTMFPSAVNTTWSTQTATFTSDFSWSQNALGLTLATNSPGLSLDSVLSVNRQNVVVAIIGPTEQAGATVSPPTLNATWATLAPSVLQDAVFAAVPLNVQVSLLAADIIGDRWQENYASDGDSGRWSENY